MTERKTWRFPEREMVQSRTEKTSICVEAAGVVMTRSRLRWHGCVEHKDDANWVKACTKSVLESTAPVSQQEDMCASNMSCLPGRS